MPVRRNPGRRFNKVSKDIAADGRDATGWCHGFKPHFLCNGCGEVMIFRLTRADMDERGAKVWNVSVKEFHGKVFADGDTSGGNSSRDFPTAAYVPCTG